MLRALNVEIRSEVVTAKEETLKAQEQIKSYENAKKEAQEGEARAKESETEAHKELKAKADEVDRLLGNIEEHHGVLLAAKAEVDLATKEREEAEKKMDEIKREKP